MQASEWPVEEARAWERFDLIEVYDRMVDLPVKCEDG